MVIGAVLAANNLPVKAASYGKSGYGTCSYQGCQPSSTPVDLPAGLKVSINLVDGQVIPFDGYLITITPLNGAGSSFAKADIFIGGTLASTVFPDDTGTASWHWDPRTTPGTLVTIGVTGTNGGTVQQTFHVTIGPIPAGSQSVAHPASTFDGFIARLGSLYGGAQSAVRALPKPLAYGFPYILLVLLGGNILLLVIQIKREVREYHILQTLLARERAIADSKKTLMELVSHYLRTPLTVIAGGIDMLQPTDAAVATIASLRDHCQHLRQTVETLITKVRSTSDSSATPEQPMSDGGKALWRQPAVVLPLLLIAAIALPFNYLVGHAGTFTLTQVNLAIQFIIFLLLALGMYQAVRRLRLRRRDTEYLRRVTGAEADTGRARDKLITSTVSSLSGAITTIDSLLATARSGPATHFIRDGQQRFHRLLATFSIASQLRGAQSLAPATTATTDSLIQTAAQSLQSTIAARHITLAPPTNTTLQLQNPDLVALCLHNLLDNAVAYSPNNSEVTAAVRQEPGGTAITVRDHGRGIPADKLSQLFQPFSKAEGAEQFDHEGMGFSLYLTKLIMTYLGGSVALESSPQQGTTATLHLPSHPA